MAATAVARRGLAAVLLLGRRRLLPVPSPSPSRRLLLSAAAASLRPLGAAARRCSQVGAGGSGPKMAAAAGEA